MATPVNDPKLPQMVVLVRWCWCCGAIRMMLCSCIVLGGSSGFVALASFSVDLACIARKGIETGFPGQHTAGKLQVTPKSVTDKFTDPNAAITVLMAPRDDWRGVLYSHSKGDLLDTDVRDLVLVAVLDKKLTFQDLVALPKDTQIKTLLDGMFHKVLTSWSSRLRGGSSIIVFHRPDTLVVSWMQSIASTSKAC